MKFVLKTRGAVFGKEKQFRNRKCQTPCSVPFPRTALEKQNNIRILLLF